MDWLIDALTDFAHWLLQALLWLPKKIFAEVLGGLASAITAIPVPSWISNIPSYFAGIPSGVWWWLSWGTSELFIVAPVQLSHVRR